MEECLAPRGSDRASPPRCVRRCSAAFIAISPSTARHAHSYEFTALPPVSPSLAGIGSPSHGGASGAVCAVKPIEITSLVKRYAPGPAAVDGISLLAEQGAVTTLLGPSGCGKTTTLRCIAGLETPDEGEIRMGEQVLFSSRSRVNVPSEDRNIGMVFQNYALWPHMSVRENIGFGLALRGWSRSRRSEEHTSELQSRENLVCRLLLET